MKSDRIIEDLQAPGYAPPSEGQKQGDATSEVEHDTEGGGVYDAEGKSPVLQTKELPDAEKKFAQNRASIQTPKVLPTQTEDYFGNLFDGEELTENFKNKISVVFESAVNTRVSEINESLTHQFNEAFEEQVTSLNNDMTSKLDEYLEYVVDTWLQENRLSVEQGIRTEIAENFIEGLKGLFEHNNIDIPESKVDVVEQITNEYNGLLEYTNELVGQNITMHNQMNEANAGMIFNNSCHGLTDMQIEKFVSLAEGIEYVDPQTYSYKLEVIKNNYFTENAKMTEDDVENTLSEQIQLNESPVMNSYMNTLSRLSNK